MIRIQGAADGRRSHSRNKKWVVGQDDTRNGHTSDHDRWERGSHRRRGGGRGRTNGHHGTHLTIPTDAYEDGTSATEDEGISGTESAQEDESEHQHVEPETPEERERFYQELVKQREVERKKAIVEGKMDDPQVPKRLDEAITMVGTCMDMCPRFERYRRERENNLDKWEVIPGTKRVDHKRAVKIYERAAGDKTLPSDLRPPPVLKKTLDYLFHQLLVKEGFTQTHDFIRDRSRAVRNDFTMQHETGTLAIECHDRCARYHILALHLERDTPRFSIALEEQQLMYTLQSLKEFYEDQRGRYQAPTELEMRVYHRLIHIRDQRERHEEVPHEVKNHPVFQLTTQFRLRVQATSAPITKTSQLAVDEQAMQIFSRLAAVLREQNNVVMIYLVACIIERHFGKECIDNIEAIRDDLSIPDIIDGISKPVEGPEAIRQGSQSFEGPAIEEITEVEEEPAPAAQPLAKSPTQWLNDNFGAQPPAPTEQLPQPQSAFAHTPTSAAPSPSTAKSAFANLGSTSAFAGSTTISASASAPAVSAFGNLTAKTSIFGGATFGPTPSTSAPPTSVFGGGGAPKSVFGSTSASIFGSNITSTSPSITAPSTSAAKGAPPLTAQPTWPAESSIFGSMSNTLASQPTTSPPRTISQYSAGMIATSGPSLNPFAPKFVPQVSSEAPSSTSPPSIQPHPTKPSVFSSDIFSKPATSDSSLKAPVPTSGGIFSVPLVAPQPPAASVVPPSTVPSAEVPTEPASPEETPSHPRQTPIRIIDRRQTLWDIPGSSSPISRLKEDRLTFTPPPGSFVEPRTPLSPTAPPPALGRVPTVALPSTPTTRWFEGSQLQESDISLSRKRSLLHFPSITIPTPTTADILSPIHVTTPTPGKAAPAANGGPSPLYQSHVPPQPEPTKSAALPPLPSAAPGPAASFPPFESVPAAKTTPGPKPVLGIQTNGFSPTSSLKGKAKATEADLTPMAIHFHHTVLLQCCWRHWRKRIQYKKDWQAAVQRSKAYQEQVQLQRSRLGDSVSARNVASKIDLARNKKRRISAPTETTTAQMRRAKRRRSSQFAQPLTDDALAQRLQENFAENEKRWTPGSFRRTVLDSLTARLALGAELSDWCVWVSTNTENDKTAIWVEHKFDVPSSGYWVSESVFSIPAFGKPEGSGSPGLIVFERTPLDGVDDEFERKYRVLDDCTRLRDILETLPPEEARHYVPCLFVINWSEKEDDGRTRDLVDMTQKLVRDGVIKHVSYFNVSTTARDLDKKFAETIDVTPLDIEDELSVAIGWKDIRRLFITPVETAVSDLLDSCWPDGEFDWIRYDRVLVVISEILNSTLRAILSLFDDVPSNVTIEIPEDLPQPGVMGRGYATGQFTEALTKLLLTSARGLLGKRLASPVVLPQEVVDAAVHKAEKAISVRLDKLRQLTADAAFRASKSASTGRPSPKRQASDRDLRLSSSFSAKRLRTSPSEDEIVEIDADGRSVSPPPSTSATTDVSEKPLVTVAMLRALTQDVLKAYGK